MSLRKKIALLVLVMGSFCFSLRGQDTLSRVQLSVGANYFPALYFPPLGTSNRDLPWGYHCGVIIPKSEKLAWRTGLNFNYSQNENHLSKFISVGINFGLERRLTSISRKWFFSIGSDLRLSFWAHGSASTINANWIGGTQISVGPVLLFGRNFGNKISICSETGIDVGYYNKNSNPGRQDGLYFYPYRLLSIHLRYKI